MAKTKADWLKEAKELGLKVTDKDKIADIKAAIEEAAPKKHDKAQEAKAVEEKVVVAKAGKRSAKALREAEDEEERQENVKKAKKGEAESEAPEIKRGPVPVTRPLIERRSKNYRSSAKLIKEGEKYSLKDGIELATKTSTVKFDASVELHVNLGVDPKQADQNIRGTVVLPHGTGKTVRVAVFAPDTDVKKALEAGADIAGEGEFLEQIKNGELNFDVLISTPQLMAQLGRFAKVLGPKGLMPNPKSGTVAKDVVKAVKAAKAGRLEYRVDKQSIIHCAVGKVSFGPDKLVENASVVLEAIKTSKPSSIKGTFFENITVTTSMGPGIPLDTNPVVANL